MSEFPEDIKKDAEEAVAGFMGWVEGGNTTASLSEHAVAGLKHSFASAILAERERNESLARELGIQRMMFGAGLVMIGMAGLSYAGAF